MTKTRSREQRYFIGNKKTIRVNRIRQIASEITEYDRTDLRLYILIQTCTLKHTRKEHPCE